MLVQKVLKNAYIGIPNPTSIVLNKSSISLTTIGQTEQLTATIEPTISDHSVTWSSDDTTVATVSTTGLVTCVTPGECTITATTSNGLTASCSIGTSRLPVAYQEVERVGLSGTQWISSFRFPVDFKFTLIASFNPTSSYYNVYDTTEVSPMLWVDTSGKFEMNINYKSSVFTKNSFITVVSDSTGANNTLSIDGTTEITAAKITSITKDTTLFHRGSNDGFKGKIQYVLLEDGNTKVFEMIPCYRIADSVIGMFDLVNGIFYTNSGTGTFTKGPNVN